MSNFDDANVDKELLNQIFADEGEDAEADALLDELLNGTESGAGKADKPTGDATDKKPEEAPAVEEKKPAGQKKEFTFESDRENDSVRKEAMDKMDGERASGQVTTITSGTTINGGISSDGSLEVMGSIIGDVECQGKVAIVGSVSGNVIASEIYVSTERLEGSLSSEGVVKIGVGTIVVGDVDATSAYIAGAVKGNIDVNGDVVVDSTAIIKGDIKAKSVQMNNGAVVDGYCSLNYAGVDLESFFAEK